MKNTIKLGISSCLLGNKVRYDGTHNWDRFITNTLRKNVELISVCPEAEFGFGIPREPITLVGNPESPRLITVNTKKDLTQPMSLWARKRIVALTQERLWGFLFKSKSPSCGIRKVKVYNEKGVAVKKGKGVFARIFMEQFPLLPVEDEEGIHNPETRENFIERVFALKQWQEFLDKNLSQKALKEFHAQQKFLFLSHSPKHFRMMGKLLGQAQNPPRQKLFAQYQKLLIEALKLKSTPRKNTNALKRMVGYCKKQLSMGEKQEILKLINLYAHGEVPLIVPITIINHYVRKYNQPLLKIQSYLTPDPIELCLRNHA